MAQSIQDFYQPGIQELIQTRDEGGSPRLVQAVYQKWVDIYPSSYQIRQYTESERTGFYS